MKLADKLIAEFEEKLEFNALTIYKGKQVAVWKDRCGWMAKVGKSSIAGSWASKDQALSAAKELVDLGKYESKIEEYVEWDDVPPAVQKKIARLEKQLDDYETFNKDTHQDQIEKIKAEIKRLEKPYTKKN